MVANRVRSDVEAPKMEEMPKAVSAAVEPVGKALRRMARITRGGRVLEPLKVYPFDGDSILASSSSLRRLKKARTRAVRRLTIVFIRVNILKVLDVLYVKIIDEEERKELHARVSTCSNASPHAYWGKLGCWGGYFGLKQLVNRPARAAD